MSVSLITIITAAAKAASIPPALLLAICTTETGLHNSIHQDDGGTPSVGICQVKETTARLFNRKVKKYDLWEPRKNARYAALYLARQLKRYHGDWVCAATAYNRGSVHVVDTNYTKCHSKYSDKVMQALKGESWKTYKVHGRTKRHK